MANSQRFLTGARASYFEHWTVSFFDAMEALKSEIAQAALRQLPG